MLSSWLDVSGLNEMFISNTDHSVDSYANFDLTVVTGNRISFM